MRCFDDVPTDTFAARHCVCSFISVDVIGLHHVLRQDFTQIDGELFSIRGTSLPVKEIVGRAIIDTEEDRDGTVSVTDDMSIICVLSENLHLYVISCPVDLVFSWMVEPDVLYLPDNLRVLFIIKGLSSNPASNS